MSFAVLDGKLPVRCQHCGELFTTTHALLENRSKLLCPNCLANTQAKGLFWAQGL